MFSHRFALHCSDSTEVLATQRGTRDLAGSLNKFGSVRLLGWARGTAQLMMQTHCARAPTGCVATRCSSPTGVSTPAALQGDGFGEGAMTPSANVRNRDMVSENKIPRKRKRSGRDGGAHRDGIDIDIDRDSRDESVPTVTEADSHVQICWAPKSATEAGSSNGDDGDDDPHLQSPITDVRPALNPKRGRVCARGTQSGATLNGALPTR